MTDEQLLGEIQKKGLLTEQAIGRVRGEAVLKKGSAETIIEEQRLIPSAKLAELKSAALGVPYQKVDIESVTSALLEVIPEEISRTYGVIPLSLDEKMLVVGMVQPDDTKAQDAVKFIARRKNVSLGVYLVAYADWQAVLRKYSPYRTEIARAVQAINTKSMSGGQKALNLEDMESGEEAPIIKIVADTLKEAVYNKASDIHIEPQENSLRIRFRMDGDLRQVASLPVELCQPVISRIKVIASLKIDEMRMPQDGRFRSHILDKDIDFRVATFPTPLGEKVALRVLDASTGLKSFDSLWFLGKNLEIVKAGIEKPFGMILITGPTGSGKTTSLYAFLQSLNNEDVNIVSLEDPVEYFVSGINQSQVRPEIGYDFASGLREIVRQDPDVIMVGEIRDNETASLAVQAALTGHVVLSTLHTNNAAGVIPRLIDMKVEPFLLPVALNMMIAQRLVGLLCPQCKSASVASPEIQKAITAALSDLPPETKNKYAAPYQIWHSAGCSACKGRGVQGRGAIYEVFRMTPSLEDVISMGVTVQKIIKEAKAQGMITLRQDGVIKALDGFVSMEEILRETEE